MVENSNLVSRRRLIQTGSAGLLAASLPVQAAQASWTNAVLLLLRLLGRRAVRRAVVGLVTGAAGATKVLIKESVESVQDEIARLGLEKVAGQIFELAQDDILVEWSPGRVGLFDGDVTVEAKRRIPPATLYAWLYTYEWSVWENVWYVWYWDSRARVPLNPYGYFLSQTPEMPPGGKYSEHLQRTLSLSQLTLNRPGPYEIDVTLNDFDGEQARSKPKRFALLPSHAIRQLT